jgi:DNA helicase-2/ATP-dependent DNA helicase PcrA
VNHLDGLNTEQLRAVKIKQGPLLIVAGAGAGKTKTLAARIVELIHSGVPAGEILAVTFTNKAAHEMEERVSGLLAKSASGLEGTHRPFLSTFHGLGAFILREESSQFGFTKHFRIFDEEETLKFTKEALRELGFDPKEHDPRKIRNSISRKKGDLVMYDETRSESRSQFEDMVNAVWERYEKLLKAHKGFDFDDLLVQVVKLFKAKPKILKKYQDRWHYILIDEYQDTNEAQYELARELARAEKNICVVGDADQNIYSWRGANIKNILHFERDYPNATIIFLEENYRSTETILTAANSVIEKNTARIPKTLFTKRGTGEQITLTTALDENDEAEAIAGRAVELLDQGVPAHEIAILFRANFQSRVLEEIFLSYSLPYKVLGVRFFERREIKDVLSYYRAALDPESLSDIKRIINIPARGLGKVSLVKLFAGKKEELPAGVQFKIFEFYRLLSEIKKYHEGHTISETLRYITKTSGLEESLRDGDSDDAERLQNIGELVTLASRYDMLPREDGVLKLFTDAALESADDGIGKNQAGITLMTVHAAKGLEFAHVFVSGLEEGLFPHERVSSEKTDSEEERRLFYVALTRAKERLYLSYAETRSLFGTRLITIPSSFLADIPPHLITLENTNNAIKTIYI